MGSSTFPISSSASFWISKVIDYLPALFANTTIYGILHGKYQRAQDVVRRGNRSRGRNLRFLRLACHGGFHHSRARFGVRPPRPHVRIMEPTPTARSGG